MSDIVLGKPHHRTAIKKLLKVGKASLRLVGSTDIGFRLAGEKNGLIIPIGQTFSKQSVAVAFSYRKYKIKPSKIVAKRATNVIHA